MLDLYYSPNSRPWTIIASMAGLRFLRIHIYEKKFYRVVGQYLIPNAVPSLASQKQVLEPLKAIKGLEVFEVGWPWKGDGSESALQLGDDVPFHLVELDQDWDRLARIFFYRMSQYMWA